MRTPEQSCQHLVGLLTKHTRIEWSFGYLGNTYGIPDTPAYRDDRFWYAFAAHPGRVGTKHDSIGGYRDPADLVPLLMGAVQLAVVQNTPR
jgi:hypothetical protein